MMGMEERWSFIKSYLRPATPRPVEEGTGTAPCLSCRSLDPNAGRKCAALHMGTIAAFEKSHHECFLLTFSSPSPKIRETLIHETMCR
jgi:hypothetical protein